jgi:hypothetical protein
MVPIARNVAPNMITNMSALATPATALSANHDVLSRPDRWP